MNKTQDYCYKKDVIDFTNFTFEQIVTLTVINMIFIVINVITNAIVIYVLVKTEQMSNITLKLIFMLSLSDLAIGAVAQPLYMMQFFNVNCSIVTANLFLWTLFMHVSGYIIAIIGIDRFIRIKYYAKFKVIWTTRVVLTLLFIGCLLALCQAFMITISLLKKRNMKFAALAYVGIDSIIIGAIIFLQFQTIRASNAVRNESTVTASNRIDKKITKLSLRIMLILCFFVVPCAIIFSCLRAIKSQLNGKEKSSLDFIWSFSTLFIYANSFVKRFFQELIKK